jgi:endonuclease YncB( thermonuclease family)
VIEGDTVEIDGTHIRLLDMDGPESEQVCRPYDSLQYQCGARSANERAVFIAGRPIDCAPVSLDQYGQTFAVCSVKGVDLGDWLVLNGLALDWPNTRKANMTVRNVRPIIPDAGFGKETTLRLGCFEGGNPGGCSDDANSHP